MHNLGMDTVYGHLYSVTYCNYCHLELSREKLDGPVIEDHTYTANFCALCGYVNPCTHANTEMRPEWKDTCLDSYTTTTCTYLAAYWHEHTVCADCGVTLGTVTHYEDTLFTIEHEFDANGQCIHCTYDPNEDVGQPE